MPKLEDLYSCPNCNVTFHYQAPRNWFIKTFFPKANIRRFFCAKCVKTFYVKVDPEHLKKTAK
jgi:protein-arginine kinase activator protein McsA